MLRKSKGKVNLYWDKTRLNTKIDALIISVVQDKNKFNKFSKFYKIIKYH